MKITRQTGRFRSKNNKMEDDLNKMREKNLLIHLINQKSKTRNAFSFLPLLSHIGTIR